TRDTGGDIDVRLDDLTGLADLHRIRHPTGVDDRPGRTGGALEQFGELVDHLELVGFTESTSTSDHDGGLVALRPVGLFDVYRGDLGTTSGTEIGYRCGDDFPGGRATGFGAE